MTTAPTPRKRHVLPALFIGALVYWFPWSGAPTNPSQLVMAPVFSLVSTAVAALTGQLLCIPVFLRLWYATIIPACLLLIISFLTLLVDRGWIFTEAAGPYKPLHFTAILAYMFTAVFATLHFPRGLPAAPRRFGPVD